MPTASVIIPAAGQGRRFSGSPAGTGPRVPFGERLTKAFVLLAGKPVIVHTLERFCTVPAVAEVIVAVPEDGVAWVEAQLAPRAAAMKCRLKVVAGGADRPDSVAGALEVSDPGTELVVVHDAVRPLIRRAIIEEALRVAVERGAAVVGRPVDHTVKRAAADRRVLETVSREGLWLAQTPQVFRREIITSAYRKRDEVVGHVTDDAQLVEALGYEVMMVLGDAATIKITTREDLRLCEAMLAAGWPF